MKVFISGPISNMPAYNRHAFVNAEIRLSQRRDTVLSPANIIPLYQPEEITHEEYLKICFAMIDCCDKVYFLEGWQRSKGAKAEFEYALHVKKEIEFEEVI